MKILLEFARGPLFRLTFAVMVLGLARILILDIWGMIEAYRRAGDKNIPWKLTMIRTVEWLFPVKRVMHHRPLYSLTGILFHIGLLTVPLFLFAHVQLWRSGIGFGWFTLPRLWADILTIMTIVMGAGLFFGRLGHSKSRVISRKQDYLWPLLLIIPFVTGFICANLGVAPKFYHLVLLTHILSAELIFVLLPFTKIAHCVLMPLSQIVMTLAWKFPAKVDEDICVTLNKKGAPV